MRTREQLINLRIFHVTILFSVAIFASQFCRWDDPWWITISVLAIIGPFQPGLTINKAKMRVIGTIAGLLISILFWVLIQYNDAWLPVIAVFLLAGLAFASLQEYTYFITFISIMLCVNSDYLNLFFNNELIFLTGRSMCVLTGVIICQFGEYFIFRHYYNDASALIQAEKLDNLINQIQQDLKRNDLDIQQLNQHLSLLMQSLAQLASLKNNFQHSYSQQNSSLTLIAHYEELLYKLHQQISCYPMRINRPSIDLFKAE
ncbi:MAG: hypothetical protein RLZZ293_473 [Pseudomonadota bacterium]|jgi:uncharacterized membrane protein YccC